MAKESPVVKLAQRYRLAVRAEESKNSYTMLQKWKLVQDQLTSQLNKALKEIAAKTKAGEKPGIGTIQSAANFKELLRQVETEMSKYAQYSKGIIEVRQSTLIPQAIDNVQSVVGYTVKGGAGAATTALADIGWTYVDPEVMEKLVDITKLNSPYFGALKDISNSSAKQLRDAIITRVATGESAASVARDFKSQLAGKAGQFITIARTADMESYRQSQTEMSKANKHVINGWRWSANLSDRTCAACLSLNGQVFDLDEEMDSHMNCGCVKIPIVKGFPAIEMQSGDDWLRSQKESVQRATLSPSKYQAWKSGDITLSDLRGHSTGGAFGAAYHEVSLKQALAGK